MDDLQAAFRSPLRSFFGARRGTAADLRPGDLGFVGMPSDATHSRRVGTRFGPRALRAETSLLMARLARDAAGEGLLDMRSGRVHALRDPARMVDLGDAAIDELDVEATIEAIAGMTCAVAARGAGCGSARRMSPAPSRVARDASGSGANISAASRNSGR